MIIEQVTASGEKHGLINQISNSVKNNDFKNFTPENKAKMESEKKEDSRIVECEFLCSKGRHERLTKFYCRYPGDPVQTWRFIPGRVYRVPLGLVKEVNDPLRVGKRRAGLLSVDGQAVTADGSPLERDESGEFTYKFVAAGI